MEKYELVKDIEVMYVAAQSFPEGILAAFEKLESKLASTSDRTFFGLSWPDKTGNIMYKAAAGEKYSGESKKNELDHFTIRKGTYISVQIKDYKKIYHGSVSSFNNYCITSNLIPTLIALNGIKETMIYAW